MQIGALTAQLDVAQVVLITFVIFFFGLIVYLQRESNREGFPLLDESGVPTNSKGLFGVPSPKYFHMPDGNVVAAPRPETIETIATTYPGMALQPPGNPFTAGMGPAAYARRADVAIGTTIDGGPRIVPLRADPAYSLSPDGQDPRGVPVASADRVMVGRIHEVWVDRSESVVRYFEVALSPAFSGRHVLLPNTMADLHADVVLVESLMASQFADVPGTKSPNAVTLLEEDVIMAYYGAGTLYATAARSEPLL